MRKVLIELYKFDELSPEGQTHAINDYRIVHRVPDWTDARVMAQIRGNPRAEYTSSGWKWDSLAEWKL